MTQTDTKCGMFKIKCQGEGTLNKFTKFVCNLHLYIMFKVIDWNVFTVSGLVSFCILWNQYVVKPSFVGTTAQIKKSQVCRRSVGCVELKTFTGKKSRFSHSQVCMKTTINKRRRRVRPRRSVIGRITSCFLSSTRSREGQHRSDKT